MNTVFIYALKDPRNGAVRYIGKAEDPGFRLREHLRKAHNRRTYSARWICQLTEADLTPEHREKLRAAKVGKKQSIEHVAARMKNRRYSPEEREARRLVMLGNQRARKKENL